MATKQPKLSDKEKEDYVVYCHTNKINGKKYIGITKQIPQKRWLNGLGYAHSSRFYSAINKYGWDNFTHEILEENLSREQAITKEREYIEIFKTYCFDENSWGYNMTRGDFYDGNSGNRIFSEEHCKKISKSKTGTHLSEEHKEKLRNAMLRQWMNQNKRKMRMEASKKNGLKRTGIPFTEERKRNISNAKKGKPSKPTKKVFYDGKIYNSSKDLSIEINVCLSTLRSWLNGTNKMPNEMLKKGLSYQK